MTFSVHAMSVETFVPMLATLSSLLDKGAEHARAKNFDPEVLLQARLAPDMFPLAKHVQIACDNAREATARLLGAELPRAADREQTLDELKARIARTIELLKKTQAVAFDGAEDRRVEIPISETMAFEMNGLQLLRDWSLPQFYFHVVTAYAILRHNGVEIGIRDYGSHAGTYLRERAS